MRGAYCLDHWLVWGRWGGGLGEQCSLDFGTDLGELVARDITGSGRVIVAKTKHFEMGRLQRGTRHDDQMGLRAFLDLRQVGALLVQ